MMSEIILFEKKSDCCGCGACRDACPKGAISMEEDEYGFLYPIINSDRCVKCKMCLKVCVYHNSIKTNHNRQVYAAVATDEDILNNAASGGIFGTVARRLIQDGGIVCGCAWKFSQERLFPVHKIVSEQNNIQDLQGSKYVQSDMLGIYKKIQRELMAGKKVLFSGTPCQVAALYEFLGNKNTESLFTIDIICHGVPNSKMFQEYLEYLSKILKGKIVDWKFRDKSAGWGEYKAAVKYKNKKGIFKWREIPFAICSYYYYFLNSLINRDSCYKCMFAKKERVGDLSIGDFWGIEEEHPEYLSSSNKDMLNLTKGISCILVNTVKGEMLLKHCEGALKYLPSSMDHVIKNNAQLKYPSKYDGNRDKLLDLYASEGYEAIEKNYKKGLNLKKRLLFVVKFKLPIRILVVLRKIKHISKYK